MFCFFIVWYETEDKLNNTRETICNKSNYNNLPSCNNYNHNINIFLKMSTFFLKSKRKDSNCKLTNILFTTSLNKMLLILRPK